MKEPEYNPITGEELEEGCFMMAHKTPDGLCDPITGCPGCAQERRRRAREGEVMPGKTPSNAYLKREKNAKKWKLAEAKQTARLEKSNLVLQETPMIFTVPKAGRYCIRMDYGQASDESVAALMRIGEDGEPDELISILRRDKVTGKWEQEK